MTTRGGKGFNRSPAASTMPTPLRVANQIVPSAVRQALGAPLETSSALGRPSSAPYRTMPATSKVFRWSSQHAVTHAQPQEALRVGDHAVDFRGKRIGPDSGETILVEEQQARVARRDPQSAVAIGGERGNEVARQAVFARVAAGGAVAGTEEAGEGTDPKLMCQLALGRCFGFEDGADQRVF